jgi:hypothetical protein
VFTTGMLLRAGLLAALLAPLATAQTAITLKTMAGTRGLEAQGKGGLTGVPASSLTGSLGAASALVDMNADGFDDLVVGAPTLPTNPNGGVLDEAGHVYLLFGGPGKGLPGDTGNFNFASFTQGKAVDFVGEPGDRAGSTIARAGDVNGDGAQDVLIGTPNRSVGGRTASGGAYIIFGRSDFAALPTIVSLSALAAGAANRAVFVQGARAFGASGSGLGGDVDVNSDGRADVILGAPLDSTGAFAQNGTATVLFGQSGFPALTTIDLATQGAGQVTVVHGTADLQFMGFSVAGIGRFDAVLPMTSNQTHATLGDDVAIGAPGTTIGAKFFAGAVFVLRGTASGTPAASYTAADFGNGTFKAGVVYNGKTAGDQAGSSVAPSGDVILDGQGFDDFLITAPFSDGVGRPDCGSVYVIGGNFLGTDPQGFDLGLVGLGSPAIIGVHIQGAAINDGSLGVQTANAGDWNGDSRPELLVGFPNATVVNGASVSIAAGRARLLNGAAVFTSSGTVDLSNVGAGYELLQLHGELTGAHVGTGLASGDFNGDGLRDLSIGADRAPSDPIPSDLTGLANQKTGRAHVVYGPLLRVSSITPPASHFGGPSVTLAAENVPATVQVLVDGSNATVTSLTQGAAGSITITLPKPTVPGNLADITILGASGDLTLANVLQYTPLAITGGPTPSSGFPGTSIQLTGQAFSTVADTTVAVKSGAQSFPASIVALDGIAGTMTVQLPFGPPGDTPLDLVVTNSNGTATKTGVLTYLGLVVGAVNPVQGPQTSGVFTAGIQPWEGQPAVPLTLTVTPAGGSLPGDLAVEFGTPALGYRTATVTGINGTTVSLLLPAFLLGPQNTLVDIRVTGGGNIGSAPGAFTYLASDFNESAQFAKNGYGATPPRTLMAGEFKGGGEVLLQLSNWPPQTQVAILFLGLDVVNPPLNVKGGQFPINLGLPFFSFYFPFPGLPGLSIGMEMPAMDPSTEGFPLYMQVITKESQSGAVKFGFSNLLKATINSIP